MAFINLADHLFERARALDDADVIVVADMFAGQYAGGAELTTEALLEASPFKVARVRSRDVTVDVLRDGSKKFWVFGNIAELDRQLIPTICANLRYSVISFDYNYCRYRSPEKHLDAERAECRCNDELTGKLMSALMYAARALWWMSERQMATYHRLFPFLRERKNSVLSSVFNDATLAGIKVLRKRYRDTVRKGWVVCGSPSWIKGTDEAIRWCEENGKEHEVVWGLPYPQMLEKLARAEGLVFLPRGGDTCPRMVIEARLLGCELHTNDNVQHRDELWFDTDDTFDTEAYLYGSRSSFWNATRADMEYRPTLSGYTTTRDCIAQDYPFEECIGSMLGFCDEVVVVDGGSTDGTLERLRELAADDARIIVHSQPRDWSAPRFAVLDGRQKALARSLCTGEFCWQQDSDEVIHEDDYQKVRDLVMYLPKNIPLLSLPVIEYWGSTEKVRLDINVSKWRLSQNLPHITHGIPAPLRMFDAAGQLYSRPGSDGCDYVRSDTYEGIPSANFITPDVETIRRQALTDPLALQRFEGWFDGIISALPSIHHFSWFNIERKVRTYRGYWSRHWASLYDIGQADTAESNMFFDKPWSDVSEDEVRDLSRRLGAEMGGWIFHQKLDFNARTPSLTCSRRPPAIMQSWIGRNTCR